MPADHPSAVSGVLRRPFAEQVAFFRRKLGKLVPTRRWDDLTGAAHDTAFMVAGAQKADLLMDLAVSVDRAIAEGKSLDAFRKDFDSAVERHDWHGWTGEGTKGGRAWRTRVIYRTNTYVAYAAGRRAQLEAENWKFWVYKHGGSEEPRPEHLHVFDGLALPPDHPFWVKHYPPSDWGCSCYVLGARSERGVRRLGGDPDKRLPDDWDKPDPATGEPMGIGPGWGYAPGASIAGPVAAIAGKIGAWDYQIAKAFMADLTPEARDAVAAAYRRLPSVADDARRYARRAMGEVGDAIVQPQWTLGSLAEADIGFVREVTGRDVDGYDFSLAPSDILHVQRRHGIGNETDPSQLPVDLDDFGLLPQILNAPDVRVVEGETKLREQAVRYEKVIGDRRYVVIMVVRGGRRRTLALKTFYIKPEW